VSIPPGRTADVAALTKVASADVFKKGHLAARLIRDQGTVRFEYDPQYLSAGGPAVATTLPLTEEPVVTARGSADVLRRAAARGPPAERTAKGGQDLGRRRPHPAAGRRP
jgi:hypothetical protein